MDVLEITYLIQKATLMQYTSSILQLLTNYIKRSSTTNVTRLKSKEYPLTILSWVTPKSHRQNKKKCSTEKWEFTFLDSKHNRAQLLWKVYQKSTLTLSDICVGEKLFMSKANAPSKLHHCCCFALFHAFPLCTCFLLIKYTCK